MKLPILCEELEGPCCEDCHDEEINPYRPFEIYNIGARIVHSSEPPDAHLGQGALGYSCCLKVQATVRAVEENL